MENLNKSLCKLYLVDEVIALAYLTSEEIELIRKDIAGEINYEVPITLITGEIVDAGIIENIVVSKKNIMYEDAQSFIEYTLDNTLDNLIETNLSTTELDAVIHKEQDFIDVLEKTVRILKTQNKQRSTLRGNVFEIEEQKSLEVFLKSIDFQNYKEAKCYSYDIYLVFDQFGSFIEQANARGGDHPKSFATVQLMEEHLKENKLYAHSLSSFLNRDKYWYELSFKEKLENLGWNFSSKTGKVIKAYY